MRKDIQNNIPKILEWISEEKPKTWICKKINCRPRTLDSYLRKNGINYKGNQGERGFKIPSNKLSDTEYLAKWLKKETNTSSSRLRSRLISSGKKKEECEKCKRSTWFNEKIPLDLHHLNGDRFDNRLENLEILCKNCHGLTESYSIRKS